MTFGSLPTSILEEIVSYVDSGLLTRDAARAFCDLQQTSREADDACLTSARRVKLEWAGVYPHLRRQVVVEDFRRRCAPWCACALPLRCDSGLCKLAREPLRRCRARANTGRVCDFALGDLQERRCRCATAADVEVSH